MRDFAYTGQPGTCLWCGQELAREGTEHATRVIDRHFHSGDCCQRFGRRAAQLGYRLELRQPRLPLETEEERRRNAAQADLLRRAQELVPQLREGP